MYSRYEVKQHNENIFSSEPFFSLYFDFLHNLETLRQLSVFTQPKSKASAFWNAKQRLYKIPTGTVKTQRHVILQNITIQCPDTVHI